MYELWDRTAGEVVGEGDTIGDLVALACVLLGHVGLLGHRYEVMGPEGDWFARVWASSDADGADVVYNPEVVRIRRVAGWN